MSNHIPCLHVEGETLAQAYENALLSLHENGRPFKTQYDKPTDPESIDATMDIVVLNPMKDPMIHKAFPGGIEDLREYVMELEGVKDHWCKNINDPNDKRWEYTYSGRFLHWGQWNELYSPMGADPHYAKDLKSHSTGKFDIDQIEYVIEKLIKQPFTRQAQMITWMPNLDLTCFDPPCLQSLWHRVIIDENKVWHLNTNCRIRSNDAWGSEFHEYVWSNDVCQGKDCG